jgi:uncharacterized protein (DUF362 family)
VDREVLDGLIDQGLRLLTSESTSEDALRHYVNPQDKVGLKVNCLAGPMASTHPEVSLAVAGLLNKARFRPGNIIIWDRSSYELKEGGFPVNVDSDDVLCFGTDNQGVGYSSELVNYRSIGSLVSRIMEQLTSAQVNIPVLKDHGLSGVTCSLKNWFGAIHNPNKYHQDGCDPYVADLNATPLISSQQKLVICDALRVQFNGGPSYHRQWAEHFGGVILSEDPVALDFVGYRIIDRMRAENGLPSLEKAGRKPQHIFTAADQEHRLGKASLDEIDLVEKTI